MKSFLISAVISMQVCLILSMDSQKLHLSYTTKDYISGCYTELNGQGICFEIEASGFQIMDNNQEIVTKTDLQTEPDKLGMKHRVVQIYSNLFIQVLNKENQTIGTYYITPDEKLIWETACHQKDSESMKKVVSKAKQKEQNDDGCMFKESVNQLVNSIHSRLMVNAAIGMGEQGLTGVSYFILLQFYATCSKLDELINSDVKSPAFSHPTTISRQQRQATCDTFSTCPPCQNYECLGLCGKECSCWSWVCGDCCYYQGCFNHDLCCSESYFTISCMFPVQFSCDSFTEC